MINQFIFPAIKAATSPFSGTFVHFCGYHKYFFQEIVKYDFVKAVDLGNPEMYETKWLFKKCADAGTVLYSRIATEPGEDWQHYVIRIAKLVNETGVRLILRPVVFPESREDCKTMQEMWHELTCRNIVNTA